MAGPHLTTEQLAERLGGDISPRTVEGWRTRRGTERGPRWIRVGGQVRYRLADVEAWEESRLVVPART